MKDILQNLVNSLDVNTFGKSIPKAFIEAQAILELFEKQHLVLDHGFIRLVDFMGVDLSIVRNARISYNAAWRTGTDKGSDTNLINYLYKNRHNTPFEAVTFTFEIKAPIFVFRQWHRHRTQSYNELSARYKELPEEFYVPTIETIGQQHSSNKQMRSMINNLDDDLIKQRESELLLYREHCTNSFKLYHTLIDSGWPRELARSILPFATYSHMFATMNLHNLFRFLSERLHPHAQYEIRVYAEKIIDVIETTVPVAVEAFKKSLEN